MNGIAISIITSSSVKYPEVLNLREKILRVPLGLSLRNEDLSRDHEDDIIIAEHCGEIIGCLLLHPSGDGCVQLRAMAVDNHWQGKGIGKQLVQAAEQFCIKKGYKKMILHARKVAMGFYKTLGYSISGDEFIEVGIPHFIMEKDLV